MKKANVWSLGVGLFLMMASFPMAVLGQSTPGRIAVVSPPPGKAPVDISGEWEMILFDNASGNWGGRVEFEAGKSTGRIWYPRVTSTWEAITDISYSAASDTLSFHRPHGNQDYRVTVKGSSMEGTMVSGDEGGKSYRWTAQKKAQPSPPSSPAPAPAAPTPQPSPPSPVAAPPSRCGCGQMVVTYTGFPPQGTKVPVGKPITIPLDQVAYIDWKPMDIAIQNQPNSYQNWGRGAAVMLVHLKSGEVQQFDLRTPPRIQFVCGGEER